jgi:putative Mg2+ transporter-C (MgtC) family protein
VQDILTGIGFLGAGIIVKHGFDVRGLTTAAAIWATAVIGVLIGGRHYWVAAAGIALVLGTLAFFRHIEDRMSKEQYARVTPSVSRTPGLPKAQVDTLIRESGLQVEQVAYGLERDRVALDYTYVVSGFDADCLGALAERLAVHPEIIVFRIAPSHESRMSGGRCRQ